MSATKNYCSGKNTKVEGNDRRTSAYYVRFNGHVVGRAGIGL